MFKKLGHKSKSTSRGGGMPKILFVLICCIFIASCGMKNKESSVDSTIISCKGLDARPVSLHFVSDDVGYALGNIGEMYTQSEAVIYKTIDGGRNWCQILGVENHLFSDLSIIFGDNIYCYINSKDNYSINRIVSFNHKDNNIKISNEIIQAPGDIWAKNGKIFGNVYVNSSYSLFVIDTGLNVCFKKIDNYKEISGGVCCDKNNTYAITHDEQFVIQNDSCVKKIAIRNPQCITKIAEGKVLIAANTAKDTITVYEYSADSNQIKTTHTIPGYNIATGFRMDKNNKTLVGFVGNIKGHFVEYDMVCSPIEKQCLGVTPLIIPYIISPFDITENYIYIFCDRNTIQRYTLPQ